MEVLAKEAHREAREKEVAAARFIPYTSHVTRNIVKTTAGDYVFTIRLNGVSHEAASNDDINAWHDSFNAFLRNIASPNVALWSHLVRREFNEQPKGQYPEGFMADLNKKYLAKMDADVMRINELYLSFVYRPSPNRASSFLDGIFNKVSRSELIEQQLIAIQECEDLMGRALAALDRYEPHVLSTYQLEDDGPHFSEQAEFYGYLVNGQWERTPMLRGELRHSLATSRPFFGKGGTIALKNGTTHYAAVYAILEYPTPTTPGMLDGLLGLPFNFIVCQSFTFLSKPAARGRIRRQRDRMVNAGEEAQSQVDALDDALDALASNEFALGTHHFAMLVQAEDQRGLRDNISDAAGVLADTGGRWVREDVGAAAGYWALLPGNFTYRIRMGDITTLNFAGLASMHNYPIGRLRGTQWGEAVSMFRTVSGSPYYFSFHRADAEEERGLSKIDPNHKELANTMVIGQTGGGKTVLATFLLAQTQKYRYGSREKMSCFYFDKDLGAAVAIRAMGGLYYPIKTGVPSGFNPFALEPTPANIAFLERLVRWLCTRSTEGLTPEHERQISAAIRGVLAARPELRRIGAMLEFLDPTDPNGIRARLARWCGQGANAWLFDNPTDTLDVESKPIVGFDVTEFLDNPETKTPTMMYLMHRIEQLFDGRRMPIFMDEFSRLLDDEEFLDFIKNKIVTIRKQNGFLMSFLQYPEQALNSPIAQGLVSQTATQIFLPNPKADRKAYVEGLKCSESEFNTIRTLGEKSRCFLIKQGGRSVVAELNLRGFEDELAVLSGNTATSLLAERLVAEYGDDPAIWLPIFQQQRKELIDAN